MTQLDRLTYELRHLTTASPVNTRRCEHEVIYFFFFPFPLHVRQQRGHSGREKGSRDGPGAAGFDRRRPNNQLCFVLGRDERRRGSKSQARQGDGSGRVQVFFFLRVRGAARDAALLNPCRRDSFKRFRTRPIQ